MKVHIGGRYRHFKTGGEYEVIGIAHHTETLEKMVIYRALYDSPEFGPSALWARPLEKFTSTVERDGKTIPRFEYLEEM